MFDRAKMLDTIEFLNTFDEFLKRHAPIVVKDDTSDDDVAELLRDGLACLSDGFQMIKTPCCGEMMPDPDEGICVFCGKNFKAPGFVATVEQKAAPATPPPAPQPAPSAPPATPPATPPAQEEKAEPKRGRGRPPRNGATKTETKVETKVDAKNINITPEKEKEILSQADKTITVTATAKEAATKLPENPLEEQPTKEEKKKRESAVIKGVDEVPEVNEKAFIKFLKENNVQIVVNSRDLLKFFFFK